MADSNAVLDWAKKISGALGGTSVTATKQPKGGPSGGTAAPAGTPSGVSNGKPGMEGAPGGNGADQPAGGPTGKSGGGGGPSGGGPGGGGKPATADGKPGGGGKPAGDPSGKPAGDPSGGGEPSGGGAPPTVTFGSSAKENAEVAKSIQSKVEGLEAKAKTVESASANFANDAQAGKQAVEGAQKQVEAAEQAMPPVPDVPAPTGDDAKQQYESAMKISADVQSVSTEAFIQGRVIEDQKPVAKDGQEDVNRIHEAATQNAATLRTYAQQAQAQAASAAQAANKADEAAKEAQSKALKAEKEKSADKADLKKKAIEEVGHAKSAREAATKAEAIAKAIDASATKLESDAKAIDTVKKETATMVDAVSTKADGVEIKLKPYDEAVERAEAQEAECKAKLSEEDAEAILQKRYDELGGDPALRRMLEAADKIFTTQSEAMRGEIKDWRDDQYRELDKMKATAAQEIEHSKKVEKELTEYLDRENPQLKGFQERFEKLGDKKDTERGKEVSNTLTNSRDSLSEITVGRDAHKLYVEKTEQFQAALQERYSPIQETYDATEKFIADRRTEFDNQLEMDSMSLQEKVDNLEAAPEAHVKRFVEMFQAEKERIVAEGLDDLKLQAQSFDPPREVPDMKPVDWSPVEQWLAYLESHSVEELKADDPGLVKVQEAYDKAGGDPALYKKQHDAWQQREQQREEQLQGHTKAFEDRTEKFRSRLEEATSNVARAKESVDQLQAEVDATQSELDELAEAEEPLSAQQEARQKFLQRDLPQLELQLKNEQARLAALEKNKTSLETLIESDKQRHEAVQDDDFAPPQIEPQQADLASIPVRHKYVMLTGQQPPG